LSVPGRPILEYRDASHVLQVEPWGSDSVRVRAARHAVVDDLPGALDRPASDGEAVVEDAEADGQRLIVGELTVTLDRSGSLRFTRTSSGAELTREVPGHFAWPGPRAFTANGDGYYRIEQRFAAYDDERIYGLGQHQHGRLDQKGLVLDLVQRNAEVSIPFLMSSRGYGMLWNSPAVGRVELAANGTRWVADSSRQLDYWVTTGRKPMDLLKDLQRATTQGLIVDRGTSRAFANKTTSIFGFSHALFHKALYDQLLSGQKLFLHQQCFEMLKTELATTMQLMGESHASKIDPSYVRDLPHGYY